MGELGKKKKRRTPKSVPFKYLISLVLKGKKEGRSKSEEEEEGKVEKGCNTDDSCKVALCEQKLLGSMKKKTPEKKKEFDTVSKRVDFVYDMEVQLCSGVCFLKFMFKRSRT